MSLCLDPGLSGSPVFAQLLPTAQSESRLAQYHSQISGREPEKVPPADAERIPPQGGSGLGEMSQHRGTEYLK